MNIFTKTYRIQLKNLVKKIVQPKNSTDYIVFQNTLAYTKDIQKFVKNVYKKCNRDSKVVVIYFNFLWKPILDFAQLFGLRKIKNSIEPNWLSQDDIDNIFVLENFEKIKSGQKMIFPFPGLFFDTLNRYFAQLPVIKQLSLITYQIYRPKIDGGNHSVSIIIPARNESGNIKGLLSKIPKFGKKIEVIFVEGHSTDDTKEQILKEIKENKRPDLTAYFYKQNGVGKNNAVKLGFKKAKNEILMILDADLTVKPSELTKFYEAIAHNKAELVIGSRLIYPMENQAMRTLNYFGNKLFSIIFSFIIDQRIKDTLCGTKALLRKKYEMIRANQKYFGNYDPFGDFDLIFGAARLNFKIVQIPIRYGQRAYGHTNINRFRHGLLLAKMAFVGLRKIKFR